MKKTVRVNIAGVVYNIDDDAFLRLQNYLNAVERHFATSDEGKEILSDIEARISELFHYRTNKIKEVVTLRDVQEVIAIMGDPQEFTGEKQPTGEQPNYTPATNPKTRRLYRDPDDRIIAGVCSGIAAYFNIDVIVVRVIFAILLLAGGTTLFIYIVFWIVLPPARSTTQKLEMRGERITVRTIEDSIKKEFKDMTDSLSGKNKKA